MPKSPVLYAQPLPEVEFLVDATARGARPRTRSDALISVLATLEARRQAQRAELTAPRASTG